MENYKRLLRKIPFFANLDDETLQQIDQSAIIRQLLADEIVLWENEPITGMYVILSGWLKGIQVTRTGREQVIRTFGPGESFGLVTALANAVNHTRFITLEESVIEKIPTEVIFNLIHENPAIAHQMIVYLSRNLSHMIELVEDLSLKSVESRLAKFILSHAEDNVLIRKKWETQDLIASRIGTVPDVLSRMLRNFEDENIIRFDRQKISIIDMQALLAKVEG